VRVKEEVVIPEKTYEKTVRIECDLCGAEAEGETFDGSIWSAEEIEVEVRVHMTEGEAFPGDYDIKACRIDLCPTCFKEKLIPFINENGVNKIELGDFEY